MTAPTPDVARGPVRGRADASTEYPSEPIDGIVDVRAAREGEVVNVGQPIVSLVNPDDFWIRVDVEESYIDRITVGDKGLKDGVVEYQHRRDAEASKIATAEVVAHVRGRLTV